MLIFLPTKTCKVPAITDELSENIYLIIREINCKQKKYEVPKNFLKPI